MGLPRSHDEQLAQVRALRATPETESIEARVGAFLDSRFPMIVTGAAELAAQRNYPALCGKLVEAFGRFLQSPETTDKGCMAKTAIATALYNLKHDDADFFLKYIGYVQADATFGGRVDSAGELRGRCILALAQLQHPETLMRAVPLLVDAAPAARIGAIRALNMEGNQAALALLKLRALDGEEDADVLAEILMAILDLDAERQLGFVGAFLESQAAARVEAAALALGSARRPEAAERLIKSWTAHQHSQAAQSILVSIAMTRTDIGQQFLVGLVRKSPILVARLAISALAIYKHDARIAAQVGKHIDEREDSAELRGYFQQEFGGR